MGKCRQKNVLIHSFIQTSIHLTILIFVCSFTHSFFIPIFPEYMS